MRELTGKYGVELGSDFRFFSISLRLIKCVSVLFIISLLAFSAHGSQVKVCRTGCQYTSISSAIKAASPGDQLNVEAGNYHENITINKDLKLVGTKKGQVVINPKSDGRPVVTVRGSKAEVTLRSLTVSGSSGAPVDRENALYPDGVLVRESAKLNLRKVIVSGNEGCGVRSMGGSVVNIASSSLARNGNGACLKGDSKLTLDDTRVSGNGLLLTESAFARITNSAISNHRETGLELRGSSRVEVTDSKIGTCETCVFLTDESSTVLVDSIVQDAGDGVRLMKNSDIRIISSELTDCTSGMDLRESAKASIRSLKITGNDHGLSLFDQSTLTVRDSRIAYNDIGIRANPNAEPKIKGCDVRFYNNFEGDVVGMGVEVTETLQDRCSG